MIEINELECTSCWAELTLIDTVQVSGGEEVTCEFCGTKFLYTPEQTHIIDGDWVGGDKITGSKIVIGDMAGVSGIAIGRGAKSTVSFNQSGQKVKGIQVNSGGGIYANNISATNIVSGNMIIDGDFVGGDKIVMDGDFRGSNVNVNS